MVSPTMVVSTAIWCISWRIDAKGCTHPWRVSIVSHGPICIRVSLHWILTMMLFIWGFHLITIQSHWNMHSCNKKGQTQDNRETILLLSLFLYFFLFFLHIEMQLKKIDNKILKRPKKENSPELVMRITSAQLLIKCTMASSPATMPFDSHVKA